MTARLKRWLAQNPYRAISLVFLAVMLFGWRALGWDEREFGFLLLVYFMVTIGVRLDDIERAIGGNEARREGAGQTASILAELQEIAALLRGIREAQERAAEKEGPRPPPEP